MITSTSTLQLTDTHVTLSSLVASLGEVQGFATLFAGLHRCCLNKTMEYYWITSISSSASLSVVGSFWHCDLWPKVFLVCCSFLGVLILSCQGFSMFHSHHTNYFNIKLAINWYICHIIFSGCIPWWSSRLCYTVCRFASLLPEQNHEVLLDY